MTDLAGVVGREQDVQAQPWRQSQLGGPEACWCGLEKRRCRSPWITHRLERMCEDRLMGGAAPGRAVRAWQTEDGACVVEIGIATGGGWYVRVGIAGEVRICPAASGAAAVIIARQVRAGWGHAAWFEYEPA